MWWEETPQGKRWVSARESDGYQQEKYIHDKNTVKVSADKTFKVQTHTPRHRWAFSNTLRCEVYLRTSNVWEELGVGKRDGRTKET